MKFSAVDNLIISFDGALRAVSGGTHARRPLPDGPATPVAALTAEESKLSAAYMRVNHVGEVCAQALYASQALTARSDSQREALRQAALDEEDHLAWTSQRVDELGAHRSWLNPLWYAGAFTLGCIAGRSGDTWSLGFVVETERQVETHLAGHLERLPVNDLRSRRIVAQMKDDEARHADHAEALGGRPLPAPVKGLMRLAAQVMTRTAHYL